MLLQLLATANIVPSSMVIFTLIMEVTCSSETPVLQEPRGVTSLTTVFFIVTAVKISNLTYIKIVYILYNLII
jgi:hypothetical protein